MRVSLRFHTGVSLNNVMSPAGGVNNADMTYTHLCTQIRIFFSIVKLLKRVAHQVEAKDLDLLLKDLDLCLLIQTDFALGTKLLFAVLKPYACEHNINDANDVSVLTRKVGINGCVSETDASLMGSANTLRRACHKQLTLTHENTTYVSIEAD